MITWPPLRVSIPLLLVVVGVGAEQVALWSDLRAVRQGVVQDRMHRVEIVGTLLSAEVEAFYRQHAPTRARNMMLRANVDRDLSIAALVTPDGRIDASTDPDLVGTTLRSSPLAPKAALVRQARELFEPIVENGDGDHEVAGAFPVFVSNEAVGGFPNRVGVIVVVYDLGPALHAAMVGERRGAVASGLVLAALAVAVGLFLRVAVVRRLRRLGDLANAVAAGDLSARSGLSGRDELAALARSLDAMVGRLDEAAHARDRALDEAQRSLAVREEFLAAATHELRTPLTPLVLQAEVLRRTLDALPCTEHTTEVRRIGDRMKEQLDRLTDLVENLLAASRLSGGGAPLLRSRVALADVASAAVDRCRPELDRAGCEVVVTAQGAPVGDWDRAALIRVVTNLLRNALKFGAGRPVRVVIVDDGATARLAVRDEGIGIDRDDLDRIFEPFTRAVPVRHFGGLGLGLYVARELVVAHGGRLVGESAPGEGAMFVMELPAAGPAA